MGARREIELVGGAMNWLREAINDSTTGKASSKRVVMLVAGLAMSIAVVVLSVASLFGYAVAGELGAVSVPLAGLAGYGYVNGKQVERAGTRA